jgi:uncharacterized damage-inducible protein DinB
MAESPISLQSIFEGWAGYNASLIGALRRRTPMELAWRPKADMRSVGELVRHIALGRITWFLRMQAPGSIEAADAVSVWTTDEEGNRHAAEEALHITQYAGELIAWLERSWLMIDLTLSAWNADDLAVTFSYTWNGQQWAIPRQWTIFRILAHDIHHGGELSLMLGQQGIEAFELSALGGHIVMPPLTTESRPA